MMRPTSELTHDPLDDLMSHLRHLPLWMKQVVYTDMKGDLEDSLSKPTLDSFDRDECLQLVVPHLSVKGSQEMHQPSGRFPAPVQQLLRLGHQGMNVASICVALQWTLEQCCTVMLKSYQSDLLVPCPSSKIEATVRYLANETRLGEYLVQIEKLSWTQLDQALNTQQYIQAVMGEKTGIGEVLINLGFISRQDSESILFLKEESKKAFIVNKGLPLYMGQTTASAAAAPLPDMMGAAQAVSSPDSAGYAQANGLQQGPAMARSASLHNTITDLPDVAPGLATRSLPVNPASGQQPGINGYEHLRHPAAPALAMPVKQPNQGAHPSSGASLKLPPPPQALTSAAMPAMAHKPVAAATPEKPGLFGRLPLSFKQ